MNKNLLYKLLAALMLASLILAACGSQPAQPAPVVEAPVTTEWPAWATATCNNGDDTVVIDQKTVDCGEVLNGATPNNLPAAEAPAAEEAKPAAETPNLGAPAAQNAEPAGGADYQGTDQCQDGKIISNQFADISRIPIGTLEGAIVAEISWTGSGFGGFDRAVVVLPRMISETMAFVRNSKTIHLVQYCGFLKDIQAYAPNHVDALVQSSQDDQGNRPDPNEIGVYFLNLDGSWEVIREGPKGPGLAFVQQRVIMTP